MVIKRIIDIPYSSSDSVNWLKINFNIFFHTTNYILLFFDTLTKVGIKNILYYVWVCSNQGNIFFFYKPFYIK